jgi:tetratricopeptide (TPR) repeat protein
MPRPEGGAMARATLDQMLLQIRAMQRRGDLAGARALADQARARFPANPRLRALAATLVPPAADGLQARLEALTRRFQAGAFAEVQAAARSLARAYPGSAPLQALIGAASARLGQTDAAIAALQTALRLDPRHLEAATNLAAVLRQARRWDEADVALARALALKPGQPRLLAARAEVALQRLRPGEAVAHYRAALALDPGHPDLLQGLARAAIEAGDPDGAETALDQALDRQPGSQTLLMIRAHARQMRGDGPGAAADYRAVLAADPGHAPAWRGLSQVHRFAPGDPLLPMLETQAQRPDLPAADRIELDFARAKAAEDLGDLAAAFAHLSRANALRRAEAKYDRETDRRLFSALRQTAPAVARLRLAPADPAPFRPIFILGLPRSGTTLVEQILSRHPDVSAGGELPHLTHWGLDLATGARPATEETLTRLRRDYLDALAPRAQGRAWLTDKMPHNFRLVGLIRAALPEARILHVRRAPAAVLWSHFRTRFTSPALAYACDLGDLVAYHALYRDLMDLWRQGPGTPVVEVDYDALTAAPEPQTRALLAALDLPWHDACLSPQDSRRAVRTASQHQVKAGIRAGTSEDWRRYAPFLGGAFDGLEQVPPRAQGEQCLEKTETSGPQDG